MKIKKRFNTVRVPPVKKVIKIKRNSSDKEEESTVAKAIKNVKKVLEVRSHLNLTYTYTVIWILKVE